jgi:hypothetical protein
MLKQKSYRENCKKSHKSLILSGKRRNLRHHSLPPVVKQIIHYSAADRGLYVGTGPPEWPTVVLNRQSGHAVALSRQVGHFPTSTTQHTGQLWHGTAKGAKCAPEPPNRPIYLSNQWPVYIPAIGRGDLSN